MIKKYIYFGLSKYLSLLFSMRINIQINVYLLKAFNTKTLIAFVDQIIIVVKYSLHQCKQNFMQYIVYTWKYMQCKRDTNI